MKLLFLGDSITDCNHCFDPAELGNGYVRMIAEHYSDVQICNRGFDGFTVSRVYDAWQRLPEEEKNQIDIVSVLVGINDVGMWMDCGKTDAQIMQNTENFRQIYEDLACLLMDDGICRVILMEPFIFPVPSRYQCWMPWAEKISKDIATIAQRFEFAFLPLQQQLLEAAEQKGYGAITRDGIHLTEEGNRILANAWISQNRNYC